MSYQQMYDSLLIGNIPNTPLYDSEKIVVGHNQSDMEFVRYGEPRGTVDFDEVANDRKKLTDHFLSRGYGSWPREINPEFRKHVALFRAALDFWEQFSKEKVFSKEEVYFRCLKEGLSFTEFIKKSRATCLRGFTSETDTEIEEEYFFDTYTGYNSIIHERYLIHWDDTKQTDDIKYAFMKSKKTNDKEFERMVSKLFDDFSIADCEAAVEIDMIRELKNTKMYDPIKKKSTLMRHLWTPKVNPKSSYFAKRAVVPTDPGSTRDTGIGDPGTILKVKILNGLARRISERIPYCANTTAKAANDRMKRVLRNNAFLHLDFKKFGLTFPRSLMNCVIRCMGDYLNVDVADLIIDEFVVEIEETCYRTERGTMLGWLDAVNCLAVCAILHDMKCNGFRFDFITFNDDVEIGCKAREARGKLNLLRAAVIGTISSWDIPISINKTYGSRASVFLERYCYYDRYYDLDMYKEQLTVKAYSQSCVTKYPWKAKMLHAAAEQWTKSKYASDRCIDTCPLEFSPEELSAPLWCGGWFITLRDKLDMSLVEGTNDLITLGSKLQQWRPQKYTQGVEKGSPYEKIERAVEERRAHAYSSDMGRIDFSLEESVDEINVESDFLQQVVIYLAEQYVGSESDFPGLVRRTLERIQGPRDWGGG